MINYMVNSAFSHPSFLPGALTDAMSDFAKDSAEKYEYYWKQKAYDANLWASYFCPHRPAQRIHFAS